MVTYVDKFTVFSINWHFKSIKKDKVFMLINIAGNFLQNYSSESITIITIFICYLMIGVALKTWGKAGLFAYSAIAVIASNIQILTAAEFSIYPEPIVLGTVIYSSVFLANDLLTERYGSLIAKKSVLLSFFSTTILLVFMILTLGYRPLPKIPEYSFYLESRHAIEVIFSPNIAILFASQSAYIISQFSDIGIFANLKKTAFKYLWARAFLSVAIGALIDSLIFNFLAWRVFADQPVATAHLFNHYILGNYFLQVVIALINIPIFYFILRLTRAQSYE